MSQEIPIFHSRTFPIFRGGGSKAFPTVPFVNLNSPTEERDICPPSATTASAKGPRTNQRRRRQHSTAGRSQSSSPPKKNGGLPLRLLSRGKLGCEAFGGLPLPREASPICIPHATSASPGCSRVLRLPHPHGGGGAKRFAGGGRVRLSSFGVPLTPHPPPTLFFEYQFSPRLLCAAHTKQNKFRSSRMTPTPPQGYPPGRGACCRAAVLLWGCGCLGQRRETNQVPGNAAHPMGTLW